ncbi:hypothetical protein [Calothrix sp. CCY 0018]|uniref:hypothetical protein n=1 Tax=Calothrix sp. CCY 0018 TaxID=3103864 RepID=UPI0039C60B4E
MPFKKNNQYGFEKKLDRPLDKKIIGFRCYEGQADKLKQIPDWQEKFRLYIDELIKDHSE